MPGDKQTIIDLETKFWQSMVEKDADTAASMIADDSLVTGPMGLMKITPAKYKAMTEEGQWTLDSFDLTDIEVLFPSQTFAIIAYKAHQKGQMNGKPMDMKCVDSSSWKKSGKSWKCVLHTETILQN